MSAPDPERHLRELVHDMRAPVASLAAAVELFEEGDTTEAARAAVEHLRALMKWAEAAYAPQSDATAAEPVDVLAVVDSAERTLRPIFQAKSLRLKVTGDRAFVRGDTLSVTRVLLNVLGNSARYAPAGTSIDIDVQRQGASWVCHVRDHGPGFTGSEHDRHGWGMGLPLSRGLIAGMGGELHVTSSADGVLVSLELPAAE